MSAMDVKLLGHTYLNDKYRHLGSGPEVTVEKKVDGLRFQPVTFSNTGVALVNSLRKVLMEEVDSYAIKSSLELDHYEQVDSKGNSYLDQKIPEYKSGLTVQLEDNHFADYTEREKYRSESGFAKIVRIQSSKGKGAQIFYNGVEHTQILTEKMGYIPVNSDVDYVLDADNDSRVVPLDQLWLFIGKCDASTLENVDVIEPVENRSNELMSVDVKEHLLVFYFENDKWHNITKFCKPPMGAYSELGEYQSPDPRQNVLFHCNTLITKLKPNQKIKAHMRLEYGHGTKWMPVITYYKYATEQDLSPESSPVNPGESLNVQQRQYIVSTDALIQSVFINEPKTIILTLESIHKMNVPNALFRSLTAIQKWMFEFRNNLLNLFLNSEDSQHQSPLKIDKFEYPLLVLQLSQCNHSFIGLLIDYLIRYLIELVRKDRWHKKSDTGEILQATKQFGSKRKGSLSKEEQDFLESKKRHKSKIRTKQEKIVAKLNKETFNNKREICHLLWQEESSLTLLPYDENYLEEVKRRPKTKIRTSTEEEQKTVLKRLLEDTILAYRKRHPLRQEAYLTIKFPMELLNQIDQPDLDEFYFKGQTTTKGEQDENQFNFCKIVYLVLSGLDFLDNHLDRLKFQTMDAFIKVLKPKDHSDLLEQQVERFSYQEFLKNRSIPTHYNSKAPTMPYYCSQPHEGEAVRGQRKLLLTEIYFLSKYITPETQEEFWVIYAGAASGSHHLILKEMFPKVTFLLFDPEFKTVYQDYLEDSQSENIFSLTDDLTHHRDTSGDLANLTSEKIDETYYHVFPCICTINANQKLAKLAKSNNKKLLFISDLRIVTNRDKAKDEHKKRKLEISLQTYLELKDQQQIYDDNYLQYQLINAANHERTNLKAAMIKFRFPYAHSTRNLYLKKKERIHIQGEEDNLLHNEFFKGEVCIQPYAPGSTTESRLIIDETILRSPEPLDIYDDLHYEKFFSYINNVVRRSMKFSMPRLTINLDPRHKLYQKFDHLLELYILNQYVTRFNRDRIDHNKVNPLDEIWKWLLKIETSGVMSHINWRDEPKDKGPEGE
jgi:hypothetical protein